MHEALHNKVSSKGYMYKNLGNLGVINYYWDLCTNGKYCTQEVPTCAENKKENNRTIQKEIQERAHKKEEKQNHGRI